MSHWKRLLGTFEEIEKLDYLKFFDKIEELDNSIFFEEIE
jgi:hypothetical protein